ncbi:uncharacterized protein [Euphorbia lathyris]|uniref:uncharacterized protein isoform X2 n=1 Tax=Euphorbia lathyris TaxID=212925 RepID=UPI0033137E43
MNLVWMRRLYFLKASMKKMCTSTTIHVCGAHGGRIINGATSAASRLLGTTIARGLESTPDCCFQNVRCIKMSWSSVFSDAEEALVQ